MITSNRLPYQHPSGILPLAVLATAFLFSTHGAFAKEQHAHHKNHDSAPQQIQLNDGKLWRTDKPLRAGMVAIREIISNNRDAIITTSLKPEILARINSQIDEQITGIISNCKLPPAADENLHLVLADIIEGSNAIAGKSTSLDAAGGVAKITSALSVYATHFEHPGWDKE